MTKFDIIKQHAQKAGLLLVELKKATKLEQAQALGFDSVEQAQSHAAWLQSQRERHERAVEYQASPEAAARRINAGVPADTWVEPREVNLIRRLQVLWNRRLPSWTRFLPPLASAASACMVAQAAYVRDSKSLSAVAAAIAVLAFVNLVAEARRL